MYKSREEEDMFSPFEVLESKGGWSRLECRECTCVFEVNMYTQQNLEFDQGDFYYKSVCPQCQAREP